MSLMMNEFEARWISIAGKGHAAGRFRVYPDHVLNFYVQYSLAGLREVVIEVFGASSTHFDLPQFENIEVSSLEISGGIRIGLTLLDGDLARNFSVMCYDIAERSKAARAPEVAAVIFFSALRAWAELFRKRGRQGLTQEEALGLMGELLVLEALLDDSGVSPDALVLGWRGPNGDARDWGGNGTRVEIKAQRSTSAVKLRISSLNQLDDRGDRVYVVLMRLSPSETGRSLTDVVETLQGRLEGLPLARLEFDRKLALSGMAQHDELAQALYSVDDRLAYAVTERFPRLVPGNVPPGIAAAQYEIAGPNLDAYRTTWEVIVGAIHG
jgi:uncharacterized protein YbaR (Trm112 family)